MYLFKINKVVFEPENKNKEIKSNLKTNTNNMTQQKTVHFANNVQIQEFDKKTGEFLTNDDKGQTKSSKDAQNTDIKFDNPELQKLFEESLKEVRNSSNKERQKEKAEVLSNPKIQALMNDENNNHKKPKSYDKLLKNTEKKTNKIMNSLNKTVSDIFSDPKMLKLYNDVKAEKEQNISNKDKQSFSPEQSEPTQESGRNSNFSEKEIKPSGSKVKDLINKFENISNNKGR